MKRLLTGALALSLLTGTAAMAQPGHHDDHGGYAQGHDNRGDNHNMARNSGHHWARGQRLPRGYRWVQTDDNNYAMVAITTGLIASLIAANH
jgi:Ni/Co efflux regulator RcnB